MTHTNPSSSATDSVDSLQLQYEKARPDFARLTTKLEALLKDLLVAHGITVHLIESRTKDIASFREKITRASKAYTDPLTELTDLSGIRLITYYQDDSDAIGTLIQSEFLVQSVVGTLDLKSPDEFGYRSAHYIVRISDTRASLIEWGGLVGLTAEIQVRTVLQHAWAAISHKLQYKREQDVPQILRRKLSRLSALFEIADDEFFALKRDSATLSDSISQRLSAGDQHITLDQLSVGKYIETSPTIKRLCDIAEHVGFRFEREHDEAEDESETISNIIQLAGIAGMRTLAELDEAITETISSSNYYLSNQYDANGAEEPGKWGASPGFICELMLIYAKVQHIRAGFLEKLGWDGGIAARVLYVAKQSAARGA